MKVTTKNEAKNSIEVLRAKAFDNAIAFDMTVNGVTIYGCRLVEGKKGQFVSFPQRKDKNGKYWNLAYVKLTEEDTNFIIKLIEDM